ncbi:MAG: hypothetical protein K0B08_04695 [Bacteroidales bacterium]|nr:hypothetical protein [Bacteroidales bacterium]
MHLSTSTDTFNTNTGEFIFTPSEFRPFINNTKSLGNPYVSWNQLYASEGFFLTKAGIGTDNPARTLEVKGPHRTARLTSTDQGSALEFVSASSPSWAISHWSGTLRLISSTDNFSNSTDRYMFTVSEFRPFSNNALNLGTTAVQWKKLYAIDGYYTGQVGVVTQSPLGKFHVHDAVNTNAIMYITPKSSTDNDSATIFLGEDRWGDFGMYWLYDGVGDEIELWGKFATARYGPHLRIKRDNGDVAVGNFFASGYKLSVAGKVICTEVRVEGVGNWPDYVFAGDYKLMSLQEVEQWVRQHHHLPGIPSSAEVEAGGFELGDMQRRLLEKVEELTLYAIEQDKKIDRLEKKLADLENNNRKIKRAGR